MEIDPALIEDLAARSAQVAEESYVEAYALLELLQAAAVGNCALAARNLCSIRLAVAAKQQQRIGRAREAYTDVFAGIEILGRLFENMSGDIGHARESARAGWAAVKARSPGGLDVFDPEGDLTQTWERLLMWHTDVGSGHGLLSQADATLRLALHVQHSSERGGVSLDHTVPALIERCALAKDERDEQSASGHSLLAGRLLLTVGDALLEVGEWRLAVTAFNRAAVAWPQNRHPVHVHVAAQEAISRCSSSSSGDGGGGGPPALLRSYGETSGEGRCARGGRPRSPCRPESTGPSFLFVGVPCTPTSSHRYARAPTLAPLVRQTRR